MEYVLLTHAAQPDYDGLSEQAGEAPVWSPEDVAAMGAFMEAFNWEPAESGELVEARGRSAPVLTRRLHLQRGVPVATFG